MLFNKFTKDVEDDCTEVYQNARKAPTSTQQRKWRVIHEKDKHFVNIGLYANTYNLEYNDYLEEKDQYESFKNVINNIGISALGLL